MTTKGRAAALTAMPAEDRATAPTALTHAVVLAAMPAEDKAAAPTVVGSSPVAAEMAAINPTAQRMVVDLQKDAYQIASVRHVRLNTTAVIAQELTSDLTERGIAATHLIEKVGQLGEQDTEPKQSMHIGRVQKPEQQVRPLTTRESAILQGCINAIQSGTIAAPNLALTQLGQRLNIKQMVAEIDSFLWDIKQALGTKEEQKMQSEEERKCNSTHAIGSGSMSLPLNIASLHRHLQKMAMECSRNRSGLCLLVLLLVVLRIVMQQSCQVHANSGTHRLVEAVQTCYLALGQFE